MRKALEQKLVERWPTWFNTKGDFRDTAMPRGFCCDNGWFNILGRLFENLEPLVANFERTSGLQFEVLQVKEKFGELRIHVNDKTEEISQAIGQAQLEALLTCEICSKPGQLREGDWIKTLCDEHASANE
jgi:hypothetical protein